MQFIIDKQTRCNQGQLYFDKSKKLFYFEPTAVTDVSIMVGEYLDLCSEIKSSNSIRVKSLYGEVSYTDWINEPLSPPLSEKGGLFLSDAKLDAGTGIRIIEESDLKVTFDEKCGWVKFFWKKEENTSTIFVEFANDCIAGITDEWISTLWLKPKFI
ncbi:MAG: hypothetical protein WCP97_01565 [bacterium]